MCMWHMVEFIASSLRPRSQGLQTALQRGLEGKEVEGWGWLGVMVRGQTQAQVQAHGQAQAQAPAQAQAQAHGRPQPAGQSWW
jgi:hypothetical protein